MIRVQVREQHAVYTGGEVEAPGTRDPDERAHAVSDDRVGDQTRPVHFDDDGRVP